MWQCAEGLIDILFDDHEDDDHEDDADEEEDGGRGVVGGRIRRWCI